ncbi:MAG: pro-sigmaK processing inhibitor BofA family protein [Bacillota bacterium]|nr:pro-sigmaK processing inhibitor BofA family protein [Bacillota bacterium]HHU61164.1 pro-sigmaK processing inhibitor BofA [Natronincola sp.]
MNLSVIIAYIVGVSIVVLLGRLLVVPLKVVFRLIVNAIIGAGILLVINLVGAFWEFRIGINPITALVVGLMGVPGVILLIALRLIL